MSKKRKKPDTIKVRFHLSIGFPTASHDETVEFEREHWESLSSEEKDEELQQWCANYIDAYFKEAEDDE